MLSGCGVVRLSGCGEQQNSRTGEPENPRTGEPENPRTGEPDIMTIAVVCALICKGDKLLIVQYGPGSKHPGKWEFPGGKVHEGETHPEALLREIREELGVEVKIVCQLEAVEFSYPEKQIRLIPFVCRLVERNLVLSEHSKMEWVKPKELDGYDLLPADRELMGRGENYQKLLELLSAGNQRLVYNSPCWWVKKCWDI